jgi:hypothetical protein
VDGTLDSNVGIAGDATNGLDVDVTRVQGTVTVGDGGGTLSVDDGGGSLTVDGTVAVSGSVAVTGPLTDAQLRASAVPVSGTFYQATQPVSGPLTDAQLRAADVDVNLTNASVPVTGTFWQATQPVSGSVSVSNFPASQAVTGTFWQATQPISGTVSLSSGTVVTQKPATSGGLSTWRRIWTASTSPTGSQPKASAGQIYGWVLTNTDANPVYVRLYDQTAAVTFATDTPKLTIMVPGNTSGAGIVAAEFGNGIAFANGITVAVTTNVADGTGTAPTFTERVIVNLMYA